MEQIYQQVANTLVNIIPERWKKLYLYAEIREGYKKIISIIILRMEIIQYTVWI